MRTVLVDGVDIAAVNGPESVVVSGDERAVAVLAGKFARTRRLRVSHAFHSSHMDALLDDFRRIVDEVDFAPPVIPVVSNLTGRPAAEELCSPEYWVRHVRDTVRFADGITTLQGESVATFLELGPEALLAHGAGLQIQHVMKLRGRREAGKVFTQSLLFVQSDCHLLLAIGPVN